MSASDTIQLKYVPLPSKQVVHESPAHNILLLGGYGDGKTSCAVNDAIDIMLQVPGAIFLFGRFTETRIKDTIKYTTKQWLPPELYREVTDSKDGREMFQFTNGSQILFRPLDEPDRFGGIELCGFVIDEAKEVKEEVYQALLGRRRQQGVPDHCRRGILCTNPPTRRHYLYRFFGPDRPEKDDFVCFHGTTYENAVNLPDGYIKTLESAYRRSPTMFKRYVLGEWGADVSGEPVHQGFHETLHVDENRDGQLYIPHSSGPLIRGWDFGAVTGGCVVWQLDDFGRCRILHEFSGVRIDTMRFATKVKSLCARLWPRAIFEDWGDPTGRIPTQSGGKSWFWVLRDKVGIICKAPPVTSREQRAEIIDVWMNQLTEGIPNITLISRDKCPLLYDGFLGEYCYAKARDGSAKETIETQIDSIHVRDAFDYSFVGALGLFPWRRIKSKLARAQAVTKTAARVESYYDDDDESGESPGFDDEYLGRI